MLFFLITHPQVALGASLGGLIGIGFICQDRKLRITILVTIALAPLLPILIIRSIAYHVIMLCDWLSQDRLWTKPSIKAAEWLLKRRT